MIRSWFNSGSPWIWLNAAAVSVSLILVFGLLLLISVRGLGHFWPSGVAQLQLHGSNQSAPLVGEINNIRVIPAQQARDAGYDVPENQANVTQYQLKTGNRDLSGSDFIWVLKNKIAAIHYPEHLISVERREWGNFYGYLQSVKEQGRIVAEGQAAWNEARKRIQSIQALFDKIANLQKNQIGTINYQMERLRLKKKALQLKALWDTSTAEAFKQETAQLQQQYQQLEERLNNLFRSVRRDSLVFKTGDGQIKELPLETVVRLFKANQMSTLDKIGHYFNKIWEFLSEDPREANTEGGVFPAIFGTVMMVITMSVIVAPFGVICAIYLREYAKQGFVTRLVRIAVNNLAGVPSIVYGVFGLGFFVYILGGNIDRLFFPEALPAPTYGTPGLLWASITLALLTLPVVIVSTEEGLARIPKSIREGSLALGATKTETLWRIILPMVSPAMMTGLILAIARAAGEVAPLMLVGVVKLAPALPVDNNFPFLHLDRKFMHLGFHIYDVGFQSPNVEAARPLVYATSLLLVLVIISLNLAAFAIRNHLREKYRTLEN